MNARVLGRSIIAGISVMMLTACSDLLSGRQEVGRGGNSPGVEMAAAARMDSLSRAIAMGLGTEANRLAVLQHMRASDVSEHKLVLQDYTQTESGRDLLRVAARATGVPEEELKALLIALPRLDFYVVSDEQRMSWRGEDNVVVAGTLTRVPGVIEAFNVDGQSRKLGAADFSSGVVMFGLHPEDPKAPRMDAQARTAGAVIQDINDGTLSVTYGVRLKDGTMQFRHLRSAADLRLPRSALLNSRVLKGDDIAYTGVAGSIFARELVTAYACDHYCAWPGEDLELEYRSTINSQDYQSLLITGVHWASFYTEEFDYPGWQIRDDQPGTGEALYAQLWENDAGNDDLMVNTNIPSSSFANAIHSGGTTRCNGVSLPWGITDDDYTCDSNRTWKEINTWFQRRNSSGTVIDDGINTNTGYGYITIGSPSTPSGPNYSVTINGPDEGRPQDTCHFYFSTNVSDPSVQWIVNETVVGTGTDLYYNRSTSYTLELIVWNTSTGGGANASRQSRSAAATRSVSTSDAHHRTLAPLS